MAKATPIISKAITLQVKARGKGGGSKQLPADPFGRLYGEYGLVKPPYSFDKLMELKESNPIHGACIEAKADDIAGLGWQWVAKDDDVTPDKGQKEALQEVLEHCNPEETFREILRAMWEDYETIGWGAIEIVTDGTGKVAEVYHVPGYTLRAHKDGVIFAQYREGVIRWFKRYGDEIQYDMKTGEKADSLPEEKQAGQLIVIKKAGGRSSFYGIPGYISALGAIVGSLAVRDFNIDWFTSGTVPDCLLIIEGADVAPEVDATLQMFFNHDIPGKRGKLAILPVPAESEGVKVRLERLTPEQKDASFRLYRQDNALEICIAHRVPPYRIGWAVTGSLGGSASKDMNEFYKASVIAPSQEVIEHRLNSVLFAPFDLKGWKWQLNKIDLTDDSADLDYAVKGVTNHLMSVDEGRKRIGQEPMKDKKEGEKFFQPSGWVEAGTDPNSEPPTGETTPVKQPQPNEPIPPVKPGEVQPVKKEDEELCKEDQYWTDWVGVHHKQEVKTQKTIEDFSEPKPSE